MRLVLERVKSASLFVDNKLISSINAGLLVLCGVTINDSEEQAKKSANKIANMRIFEDENGKLNKSILEVKGEVLLVSNFTLCTVETSGNRPSFSLSAEKDKALKLYNMVAEELKKLGVEVQTGVFGADMQIKTQLDGPITIYKEIN